MATCKPALVLLTSLCIFQPVSAADVTVQKTHPGNNVNLTCHSNSAPIRVVQWIKSDLQTEEYVFLYRDGHIDTDYQHPSFKNRVELRDGEMKNGDLSLTLKNLTKNDSGTYECRIKAGGARRGKRAVISSEPISTIDLKVVDPEGRRRVGVAVSVTLAVITAAAVIFFMIHRKQGAPGQDFKPVHSVIQT